MSKLLWKLVKTTHHSSLGLYSLSSFVLFCTSCAVYSILTLSFRRFLRSVSIEKKTLKHIQKIIKHQTIRKKSGVILRIRGRKNKNSNEP